MSLSVMVLRLLNIVRMMNMIGLKNVRNMIPIWFSYVLKFPTLPLTQAYLILLMAPKKKGDFVEALKKVTSLDQRELEKMGVEKLRLLYRSVQPQKVASPLPANWKKFNRAALQELYLDKVVAWEGAGAEGHGYLHWSRDRLIVELENYVTEVKAEAQQMKQNTGSSTSPTCPECNLAMVER